MGDWLGVVGHAWCLALGAATGQLLRAIVAAATAPTADACAHPPVLCRSEATDFIYMPIRGWIEQQFANPLLAKDIGSWPDRRSHDKVLRVSRRPCHD